MRPAIAAACTGTTIGIVVALRPLATRWGIAACAALTLAVCAHAIGAECVRQLAELQYDEPNSLGSILVLGQLEIVTRILDVVAAGACLAAAMRSVDAAIGRQLRATWLASAMAVTIPRAVYDGFDPGFGAYRVVEVPGVALPEGRTAVRRTERAAWIGIDRAGRRVPSDEMGENERWSPPDPRRRAHTRRFTSRPMVYSADRLSVLSYGTSRQHGIRRFPAKCV